MDERSLGKQLQLARQAAGLTQQQLCHQANLSFSTLTKIERGAIKSPSIFTIQSIASALDMSLDELLGDSAGGSHRKLRTSKNGVKFIYFDVNGCLVYFYQRAFDSIAADNGLTSESVEAAFWHFNDEACNGTLTLEAFNEKMNDRLNIETFRWQDYYVDTLHPIQEMQDVVIWAAGNYRVGLLTNIIQGMLASVRRAGKLPDVDYDSVVDSFEVKAIKPETKMYEIAQQMAGCQPHEILFIDDSRANVMAAERLGWQVMWFDDSRPQESAQRVREALEPAED